jgi:hypothetical protein
MVNWINLCAAIAKNAERGFSLGNVSAKEEPVVERFRLSRTTVMVSTPLAQAKEEEEEEEDLPPPPPPTKSIGMVLPPTAAAPHTVPEVFLAVANAKPPVRSRLPLVTKQAVDPVVVGIERAEPLYMDAPFNNKHSIEVTVALALESQLNELYKTEGGRSRGWTKSGLDLWMKPRCASGGNLKELDRAKAGFVWQLLMDDKAQSAFLDFVCVAKRIRIAVWFDETKTVLVYPAADLSTELGSIFPLYHVSAGGYLMKGPINGKELYSVCAQHKYTVLPPLSVMGSLSGLKLDELENVGKQLGMPMVEGKKVERVAAIAAYKLQQRFEKN